MKKIMSVYSFLFLLFSPIATVACGSESPIVVHDKINENISVTLDKKHVLQIDDFSSPELSTIISQSAFTESVKENKIPHSKEFSFADLKICSVSPSTTDNGLLTTDEDFQKGYAVLEFLPTNQTFFGYIRITFWINSPPKFDFTVHLPTLIDATEANYLNDLPNLEQKIWSSAINSSQWDKSSQAPKTMKSYKFSFKKLKLPIKPADENRQIAFSLQAKYKLNSHSIITITGQLEVYVLSLPTVVLDPTKKYSLEDLQNCLWDNAQNIPNYILSPVKKSDYEFLNDKNGPLKTMHFNTYLHFRILFKHKNANSNSNEFLTINGIFIYKNRGGKLPIPPSGDYPGENEQTINLTTPYLIDENNLPDSQKEQQLIWDDVNSSLGLQKPLDRKKYYLVENKGNNNLSVSWDETIKNVEEQLAKPVNDQQTLNYVNVTLLALNKGISSSLEANSTDLIIHLCFMNTVNNYSLAKIHVNVNEYVQGEEVYNKVIAGQINDFAQKLQLPSSFAINHDDIQSFNKAYEQARTTISENPTLLPFNFHMTINNNHNIVIQLQTNLLLINKPINEKLKMDINLKYFEGVETSIDLLTKKVTDQAWRKFTNLLVTNPNKDVQALNTNEKLWDRSSLIDAIETFLKNPAPNSVVSILITYKDQHVYNETVILNLSFTSIDASSKRTVNLPNIGFYDIPYFLPVNINQNDENDFSYLLYQETEKIIAQLKLFLPNAVANAYKVETGGDEFPTMPYIYEWQNIRTNILKTLENVAHNTNEYDNIIAITQDLSKTTVANNTNITFTITIKTNITRAEGWYLNEN